MNPQSTNVIEIAITYYYVKIGRVGYPEKDYLKIDYCNAADIVLDDQGVLLSFLVYKLRNLRRNFF